jgi:predicted nucleic-acid-binding Zn-ribbon protein
MVDKIQFCPYCGGTGFVIGKQEDYASVTPADRALTLKSQKLYHIICLNCGSVVRSYVENPSKLI